MEIWYLKMKNMEKEKFYIEVVEKNERCPMLIGRLLHIWEASVRASHRFLAESDINRFIPQVENALLQIETLWVMQDNLLPVGFMGVQERKIEMLFLHPAYIHKGLGRMLVERALRELQVEYVDVNEQNSGAAKFYGRMGFETFNRNEYDNEGNHFPILEMRKR